jgi:hypothetical protein
LDDNIGSEIGRDLPVAAVVASIAMNDYDKGLLKETESDLTFSTSMNAMRFCNCLPNQKDVT